MHKQLFELFLAKAKIEAEIRRTRVIAIRKVVAALPGGPAHQKVFMLTDQMNLTINRVAYDHEAFDALLDIIEDILFTGDA